MNAVHDYADRLLDLAYGELPTPQARELEAHVRGCSQCANALDDIKGVRRVMGQLPVSSEPDTGFDSLLAYAEQAARRTSAGPAPSARGLRRWLAPVFGFAAVAALGAVTFTTMLTGHDMPSPSQVLAEEKVAALEPVAVNLPVEAPAFGDGSRDGMLPPPPPSTETRGKDQKAADKSAALSGPVVVEQNSAELWQRSLGKRNDTGSFGSGKSNDPAKGAARAKNEAVGGGEGSGGYVSTTDSTRHRRDPLLAEKAAPAREQQQPQGEFDFAEEPQKQPAAERKADTDTAYNDRAFAGRVESAPKKKATQVADDERAYAAAPPAPSAVYRDAELDDVVAGADGPVLEEEQAAQKPAPARPTAAAAVDPALTTLRLLVQQAREFNAAGNHQAAAKYLRQAAALSLRHPEHAGALILLGDAETKLGNSAAAAAAWRQAELLYPSTGTSQMANRKLQEQKGLPSAAGQKGPADMKRAAPAELDSVDRAIEAH